MTETYVGSITKMVAGHGDLTIAWNEDKHAEMVEHIQALMDKGVTFHRIDTVEKGKIRKKLVTTATPIGATGDIAERKLLIKDADISKIVSAGIADIATFEGSGEIVTTGKVTSAAEAAKTNTMAVQPARGG